MIFLILICFFIYELDWENLNLFYNCFVALFADAQITHYDEVFCSVGHLLRRDVSITRTQFGNLYASLDCQPRLSSRQSVGDAQKNPLIITCSPICSNYLRTFECWFISIIIYWSSLNLINNFNIPSIGTTHNSSEFTLTSFSLFIFFILQTCRAIAASNLIEYSTCNLYIQSCVGRH